MTAQGNLARSHDVDAAPTARETARLPDRYALALYELAASAGIVAAVEKDMTHVAAALAASADLQRTLAHPLIDRATQTRVLQAVAQKLQAQPLTQKFLGLLCQKKRQNQLQPIAASFLALCAKQRGELTASVRVATPLTLTQQDDLVRALSAKHQASIKLQITVDPSVLGGMAVQVGATLYDRTLSSQLSRLQTTLEEAA